MKSEIDAIDKRIMQLLQSDGKMTIKEIANTLDITTTPVHERIKKLEKEDYIQGYSTILNGEKLGFTLVAFCTVTLEGHSKDYIQNFVKDITELDEVIECYHIAGMFDYLLKILVKDMNDYQTFITQKLSSIPNIGKVQSSFVMTEIKKQKVYNLT